MGLAIFQWLQLRCGIDTIKPDVHVLRFVKNTIGRKATPTEASSSLNAIAIETGREAYRLDSAIWHLQRGETAEAAEPRFG